MAKKECISFAQWINNTWWTPQGLPDQWLLKANPADIKSKDIVLTTEELYQRYID